MNNFLVLLTGEIQRMKKYNILGASLLVSIIWIGVLHFTEIENVSNIFPLLIFLDATSMSMLLVGVSMFFEKQEGTLKSLLISPINKNEYILAKVFSNVVSNIITLGILYAYARIFKEIDINVLGIFSAVILIGFFHSLIGFILTYYSKDFTGLLMGMLKYSFVFMIPVLLQEVGIIKSELIGKILYIIPSKSAMVLLKSSAGGIDIWSILLSTAYMILGSVVIYYFVSKKFDKFAVKESGV
ncbi:ABC transporter permease [Sporosalibacterium faouarense]|uniref:fluoroquinolone export ABC transporter permease subunit n=1 Tax=Sporosalibacterium faouarense TaxID=516123 RepID=UPI00141D7238|nr:ABC transporter permease [Sporosalibacterium faouarense]MTI49284.1 ABC transporter permease [Bacillota bacterium]